MTDRLQLETRLLDITREIEAAHTQIWLWEFEREQLRHELRRLINGEPGKTL